MPTDKRILTPVKLIDSSGSSTPTQLGVVLTGGTAADSTVGGILMIGRDTGTAYRALSVDTSGRLNINNISGTISLPTGAATSAKQPALGTAGSASTDVITVQGIASMTALKVDGSGVTQPVSGTVATTQSTSPWIIAGGGTAGSPATGVVTVQGIASMTALKVDLGSTTANATAIKVDGTGGTFSVTNAGTFAVQDSQKIADNAGFTDGTTPLNPVGFILDDVAGTALTENDIAAARIDSKRAQVFVIEDATTRTQKAAVTSGGALKVDLSATTANSTAVKVDGTGGTFPVSGTVATTQSTSPWIIAGGGTAGSAATGVVTVQGIASMTPIKVDLTSTGANATAIKVDGSGVTQPVSGTVTANQGGAPWTVTGTGTAGSAATGVVTIQGISSMTPVKVDLSSTSANGTAIKVDGSAVTQPVSIAATVTVDTELPAAASLVDATANPSVPATGAFLVGFNGTTWDRVRTANTGRLQVDVVTGGGVDSPTSPAISVQNATVSAGSSTTLTTGDIGSQYLWAIDLTASVAFKAVIGVINNGVTTSYAVVFGRAGETVQWKPVSRKFYASTSTAGIDGFSCVMTNLDTNDSADLYATFYYAAN